MSNSKAKQKKRNKIIALSIVGVIVVTSMASLLSLIAAMI